jgi:hypothetical protein
MYKKLADAVEKKFVTTNIFSTALRRNKHYAYFLLALSRRNKHSVVVPITLKRNKYRIVVY